jgi:hypothetical protein
MFSVYYEPVLDKYNDFARKKNRQLDISSDVDSLAVCACPNAIVVAA